MSVPRNDFDAIIVGARVAGSAAAIMLARQRLSVLIVDKAAFPSDTLSTHIVLTGGTEVLSHLGMTDVLERLGAVRFDAMRAIGPGFDYVAPLARDGEEHRGLCLTRIEMDRAMIDAARSFNSVSIRE